MRDGGGCGSKSRNKLPKARQGPAAVVQSFDLAGSGNGMRTLKLWARGSVDTSGKTIEQLHVLKTKLRRLVKFSLHPYSGKWALHYYIPFLGTPKSGWVLAEKSRNVRIFSNPVSAFNVARGFGQDYIRVDLEVVRTVPFLSIVSEQDHGRPAPAPAARPA
jgi:hypothetical protein